MYAIKKWDINPDLLKIYALVAMTIDHMAEYWAIPGAVYERMFIGRTAFPIFAFLLMYHLHKYQIYEKYVNRLLFFGIISLFVIFPFTQEYKLNILFTFLFPVLTLWGFEQIRQEKMNRIIGSIFSGMIVLFMAFFSIFSSYSVFGYGYLLLFYLYFTRSSWWGTILLLIFGYLINWNDNVIFGFMSMLTTLLLLNVNMSQTYPRLLKKWWIFYVYFPLHLLFILSIRYFLG